MKKKMKLDMKIKHIHMKSRSKIMKILQEIEIEIRNILYSKHNQIKKI